MPAEAAIAEPRLVKRAQEVNARLHDAAAIHLGALEYGGGQLDRRVVNGAEGVYNFFRKTYFVTGRTAGYVTIFDLAQALYPNIMNGADSNKKRKSILRQFRRLEAGGMMSVRPHLSDAGQTLGLWWEFVDEAPDPEAWPDLRTYSARRYPERARPCSSTGRAADS